MEKIALVYSEDDKAGKNIASQLEKIGVPESSKLHTLKGETVDLALDKIPEKNIVVLSKHKSSAGKKSLTVHSIGNFSVAEHGGEDRKLVGSLPGIKTNFLRKLSEKNSNPEYSVCYEVTHHGPFAEKNVCFIELGSSPEEWGNEEQAKIIAETVVEGMRKENDDKIVVGLGGGHYAPDFTKLSLRKKYSFGHICPAYMLDAIDESLLSQMIKKSGAEEIIVDWKGLKSWKQKIVGLCEGSGMPFERVQRLLK